MSKIAGSDNILIKTTVTVGTAAGQALASNKNRVAYRVISDRANTDNLYHGINSLINTEEEDEILPGGRLIDDGDPITVYKGEVWLISGTAAQEAHIEEVVRHF